MMFVVIAALFILATLVMLWVTRCLGNHIIEEYCTGFKNTVYPDYHLTTIFAIHYYTVLPLTCTIDTVCFIIYNSNHEHYTEIKVHKICMRSSPEVTTRNYYSMFVRIS